MILCLWACSSWTTIKRNCTIFFMCVLCGACMQVHLSTEDPKLKITLWANTHVQNFCLSRLCQKCTVSLRKDTICWHFECWSCLFILQRATYRSTHLRSSCSAKADSRSLLRNKHDKLSDTTENGNSCMFP